MLHPGFPLFEHSPQPSYSLPIPKHPVIGFRGGDVGRFHRCFQLFGFLAATGSELTFLRLRPDFGFATVTLEEPVGMVVFDTDELDRRQFSESAAGKVLYIPSHC